MSWSRQPVNEPARDRVPPGQTVTTKFPVLHVGNPPVFNAKTWTLKVGGEVEHPLTLTWEEMLALPALTSVSDFHCVTTWSRLDNRWEGVSFRTIVVPKRYGWKSVKWLRALYFREQDEPGFWEVRGYSNTADPWTDDRYSD
jgi:DMSO/TMAO reductase YedYZ molybdopterin-dependent catalytic subunit